MFQTPGVFGRVQRDKGPAVVLVIVFRFAGKFRNSSQMLHPHLPDAAGKVILVDGAAAKFLVECVENGCINGELVAFKAGDDAVIEEISRSFRPLRHRQAIGPRRDLIHTERRDPFRRAGAKHGDGIADRNAIRIFHAK